MLIFFFPHYIAAVGLRRFTKIFVWLNLFFVWLTVDASGSIPRVLTLHILNSVDKIRSSVRLTLPQILANSQHIIGNCLMVLNGFFDDHGFGEVFLESLVMESHGRSVQDFLLSVAETVITWVEIPVVVSCLLLPRCVVAVSPFVHLVHLGVVADEGTAHWINHFFGIFKAT